MMNVKRILQKARCYKLLLFVALTGTCRMAYGTLEWSYSGVVTNVLDSTYI